LRCASSIDQLILRKEEVFNLERLDQAEALNSPIAAILLTACCYAVQDKVWITGPSDEPWEVYTVKGDADHSTGKGAQPAAPGQ